MLKIGQNLPLDSKTAQYFVGVCAPLEYFDRDALLKLSVGALGQINGSHAAASEFFDNCVRAHSLANSMAFIVPEMRSRELREFFKGLCVVGQELFSLTEERRVIRAQFSEHRCPLFRRGLLQRICKDLLETLPACRI
jgi:hypothetical protein